MSYTCHIENKQTIYNVLLEYIAKYVDLTTFMIDNVVISKKHDNYVKPKIVYMVPLNIEVKFIYKEQEFTIQRKTTGQPKNLSFTLSYYEQLIINCNDKMAISNLINDAIEYKELHCDIIIDDINIYVYTDDYWRHVTTQKMRSLETIYINDNIKNKLIKDIDLFIATEDEYNKFCIPYKRTYLFKGIPGTGKTSLIYALASYYKRNIYIYKFDYNSKISFEQAIKHMPSNAILVIEDINLVMPIKESNSLSNVLNTLDGIIYKNKLLTFLTSNDIDNISPVILRPGRIDYVVDFDYCNEEQIKQIFKKFFPNENENIFYNKIKGAKVTPAILQRALFTCHNDITNIDYKFLLESPDYNNNQHRDVMYN